MESADMKKKEDCKAGTGHAISITDILRNEAIFSAPRRGDTTASEPTDTNDDTIARPSKTDYSKINFASILESVSSITIPDDKSSKVEKISCDEKMKRISNSLAGDASARLQELVATAAVEGGGIDPDKINIDELLEIHKKTKLSGITEEERLVQKAAAIKHQVSENTRKTTGKKLPKALSHGEGSMKKPRSLSPRRHTTMVDKATIAEREAASRKLFGGNSSSNASLSGHKEMATRSKQTTTTRDVLSTSHHSTGRGSKAKRLSRSVSPSSRSMSDSSDTKRRQGRAHPSRKSAGNRHRRSSSHSPPPRTKHSNKTKKDSMSLLSREGKTTSKSKRSSRSVSPSAKMLDEHRGHPHPGNNRAQKEKRRPRGRRGSSGSPPPKNSRHSEAVEDPLSVFLPDEKSAAVNNKNRTNLASRSVSPDFESDESQNGRSSSRLYRKQRHLNAKPGRGVSPRRATVHGKKLDRKLSKDEMTKEGRISHRRDKHAEAPSDPAPSKRSSDGLSYDSRRHRHHGGAAASRGRGSHTVDNRRRSSSHGPAERGRGGGLAKQRSLRGNMGRQNSLRGLARQESMKHHTLRYLLNEPIDGFSESEKEEDELHLCGSLGVNLPSKSDGSSFSSPHHGTRTSTAPRLTATSLRQRLKKEHRSGTADTGEESSSGEDNGQNAPQPNAESVILPYGDDEVERKKRESARQAAAKDRPQFADLYDEL